MTEGRKMAYWGAAGFIGTALLIVTTSPAHGQPPVNVIAHKDALTRVVPYGDLSLASKAGRSMLFRRVGYAVTEVCPEYDQSGALNDVTSCKKFAWRGAKPQIRRAIDRASAGSSLAMTITIQAAAK